MIFLRVTTLLAAIGTSYGSKLVLLITYFVVSLMTSCTGTQSIEFPSFVMVIVVGVVDVRIKGKTARVIVKGGDVVSKRLADLPVLEPDFELQKKSNLVSFNKDEELKSKIPGPTFLEYKLRVLVLFTPSMKSSRPNKASVSVVSIVLHTNVKSFVGFIYL